MGCTDPLRRGEGVGALHERRLGVRSKLPHLY